MMTSAVQRSRSDRGSVRGEIYEIASAFYVNFWYPYTIPVRFQDRTFGILTWQRFGTELHKVIIKTLGAPGKVAYWHWTCT